MRSITGFRRWFRRNLRDHAKDIASHGADAGWPGITYYGECCKLFDRHAAEIWGWLASDAEDQGVSIPVLLAGFRRADMCGDWDAFRNLLVWYACERCAHEIMDEMEDER